MYMSLGPRNIVKKLLWIICPQHMFYLERQGEDLLINEERQENWDPVIKMK